MSPTNSKAKLKNTGATSVRVSDEKANGASAIDFLVKVEVVKEVLRTYVPCVYHLIASPSPFLPT